MTPPETPDDLLRCRIERGLIERCGPLVGGDELYRALGFASSMAFRQALTRGTLDVPIFTIPGRRGRFALAHDVAAYLVRCRASADITAHTQASAKETRMN